MVLLVIPNQGQNRKRDLLDQFLVADSQAQRLLHGSKFLLTTLKHLMISLPLYPSDER